MTLHVSEDTKRANPGIPELVTDGQSESKSTSASKYHNVREQYAGFNFASGHEVEIAAVRMKQNERHQIFGLQFQVRFPLPPESPDQIYVADFVYSEVRDGKLQIVVEDAKAWDVRLGQFRTTPDYRRKKKLMKKYYGIKIEEV